MSRDAPIVYVLDDDYRVREALSSLLSSGGVSRCGLRLHRRVSEIEKARSSRMFDIGSGAAAYE
jgi:FixJ family two-component response regulator